MFEQSQNQITREDIQKIKKSIRDPQFNAIMQDYMLEISDPKNKEEQDKYLLQLEKEGDLPSHLQLIQPRKCFCVQTNIASEMNYNYSQILYINICVHQEIEESKIVEKNEKGAKWQLPYQIGKQRYDQDVIQKKENEQNKVQIDDHCISDDSNNIKQEKINSNNREQEKIKNKKNDIENNENIEKKIVSVIDVCFNDNIEKLCKQNNAFKKMVTDSAIEGVQKRMNEKKEKIDKDYKYIEYMLCKGESPSIMPIQKKIKNDIQVVKEKSKLYHEIMNIKKENQKKNEKQKNDIIRCKQEDKNDKKIQSCVQQQIQEQEIRENIEQKNVKKIVDRIDQQQEKYPICPIYRIVYQYETESEDYYDSKYKQKKQIKQIRIDIELEKVEKISKIKCDIDEQYNLILEYENIYYMRCKLSNNIRKDEYRAKYDKQKKQLQITFEMNKEETQNNELQKKKDQKQKYIKNTEKKCIENNDKEQESEMVINKNNVFGKLQNQDIQKYRDVNQENVKQQQDDQILDEKDNTQLKMKQYDTEQISNENEIISYNIQNNQEEKQMTQQQNLQVNIEKKDEKQQKENNVINNSENSIYNTDNEVQIQQDYLNNKKQDDIQKEKIDIDVQKVENDIILYNEQYIDDKLFITFKVQNYKDIIILNEQQNMIIIINKNTYNNIILEFENHSLYIQHKIIKSYVSIIIQCKEDIKYKLERKEKQKIKEQIQELQEKQKIKEQQENKKKMQQEQCRNIDQYGSIEQQKIRNQKQEQNKELQNQKVVGELNDENIDRNIKKEIDEDDTEDDVQKAIQNNNYDFLILDLNREVFNLYQLI